MLKKLIVSLSNSSFMAGYKRWIFNTLVFIILVSPVAVVGTLSIIKTINDLTELTLSRRQAISSLAAATIQEKLDHLVDIGVSLATRVKFRQLIAQGKYEEAIDILASVPRDFPFIERVFIADATGVLLADTPPLPGVRGKNFAQKDWYKGVTSEWKPYISEVYKRTAEPQYNVIVAAVPIKSEEGDILGILVLQVKIDSFFDWTRAIDVGPSGFVYITDKKGQIVAHPKYPSQGEIIDYSSAPSVEKALKGESGVEVHYNSIEKEDRISAYEPVAKYGWAVVTTQPKDVAFAQRDTTVRNAIFVYVLVFILNSLVAYLIILTLQTLKEIEQRQTLFLESIGDGVIGIDRGFVITLFNPTAGRLTGFSPQEAIGKPMREVVKFVNEKDRSENITFIEEAMLFGKAKQMANNTVLITKTGTEIPVGDSAAPILSADGIVNGAIIVFRDVTMEREVKRMKDEFISVASHELRTPMTAISGFASMILDGVYGPVNENLKEPLGYVAEGSDRLIKLVSDMLNVSRIEAGRLKFELTSLDLGKLASEVVKSLEPVAQEKGVGLSFKEAEVPLVQADADKVKQILNNLVGNSLKFTDKKGSITVSLVQDGNFVKTDITDTGIGIAQEDQKKLFQKFAQIASQVNGRPKGTGLGLYISRELARKMGGELWIESSQIGKGSNFAFSLPLTDSEAGKKIFEGIQKESELHPDQK